MQQASRGWFRGAPLALIGLCAGALFGYQADDQPAPDPVPERIEPFLQEPQEGDRVRVLLSGGGELEGELVSYERQGLVVRVGRIDMRLMAGEYSRVIRLRSALERFMEMRLVVDDTDVDALVGLARWARDEDLLDEALDTVGAALELNPASISALELNREITFLMEMQQDAGEDAPEDRNDERRDELDRLRIERFPYLTDEQVNLIKVYELDLKNPPRMRIPSDVVTALLNQHSGDPLIPTTDAGARAFRALPDAEILDVIFRLRARDLYPRVRVVGQLEHMRAFRDRVNAGWLTRSCATTDCHGGLSGGRFLLANRWRRTERGVYTNFYILTQYESAEGLPMIDTEQPRLSLMLQMGLPREQALWAHPEVNGWQPAFKSEEDRWFLRTVEWIDSLYVPRPEYDLGYQLPGDRPRAELRGEDPAPGGNEGVVR